MEKNNSTQLKHHGVVGQKWGVRRYQNKDGSLTAAGKKRAGKADGKTEKKPAAKPAAKPVTKQRRKSVKDMSDAELRREIDRLSMEKRYSELKASTASPGGKRAKEFALRVLERSGENLATQVLNHLGAKALNKALGTKTQVTDAATGAVTTVVKDVIFANNKRKDK